MASFEDDDAQSSLSLPEDLLIDIGSRLDNRDLCHMELASKRVLDSLSRLSRDWPCERELKLTERSGRLPLSSEACRFLKAHLKGAALR